MTAHELHVYAALVYMNVDVAGILVAGIYAFVKGTVTKATGHVPKGKAWRWIDAAMEMSKNIPGFVNKAMVASGRAPFLQHPDVESADDEVLRLRQRVAELSSERVAREEARTQSLRAVTLREIPVVRAPAPTPED